MAKKSVKKTKDVEVVEMAKDKLKAVRCLSAFYDVKENIGREVGAEWQATDERIAEIQAVEKRVGVNLIEVL